MCHDQTKNCNSFKFPIYAFIDAIKVKFFSLNTLSIFMTCDEVKTLIQRKFKSFGAWIQLPS